MVHQRQKIRFDDLGRLAGSNVVVAGVDDDRSGFVRADDSVGKMQDVGHMGAAESTIEDPKRRHVLFEGRPHPDA